MPVLKKIQVIIKKMPTQGIKDFRILIEEHESIISRELQLAKVKNERFKDFNGSIKSLGAWGGDFCMVVSEMSPTETKNYFLNKGYKTILKYHEMAYSTSSTPVSKVAEKVK